MKATQEDQQELGKWWESIGAPWYPSILPELCFVQRDDYGLLCGCWLCEMELNAGLGGLISHTITNPNRQTRSLESVNQMLKEVKQYSIDNGFIVLMGMTQSRLLEKTYLDNGFFVGDTGMNTFTYVL